MKAIGYLFAKIKSKVFNNKELLNDYFRKQGIVIGTNCNICSNIVSPESFLIEIGNNVTIAGDVMFVTHDNSISKVIPNSTDLFGKIKIGNNCFIGARSTLLYGVELSDNIIVSSGSVVTKSFNEERIIIGGCPAKIISSWESFSEKNKDFVFNLTSEDHKNLKKIVNDSSYKLIKR